MRCSRLLSFCVVCLISLLLIGCGGGGTTPTSGSPNPNPPPVPSIAKGWTWVNGSNRANAQGVYATQGVASASNVPGARGSSVNWIDRSGNLWLFGGYPGLNDLWEFNPTTKMWTWVSGSNTDHPMGVYFSPGAVPGGRYAAVGWMDSSGNLWLFGGYSYDGGWMNDLWEFNPTTRIWTWVSGSNIANTIGVYGTQGVPSASNVPGARAWPVSWIDRSGNLWLFGGYGEGGVWFGYLNDLWEFNPTTRTWTWVSGSNTTDGVGNWGTQGVAAASNVPGGRSEAVSWIDSSDNLWLFGGFGIDSTGAGVFLDDLWEFDAKSRQWTWVSGSSSKASGIYGTLGVASASYVPGSRGDGVSWIDRSGNLWLFGGIGYGFGAGDFSNLNDLWKFNPTSKTWTWMGGSNTEDAIGVYGTQGVASASNVPGARSYAMSWIDNGGTFWLFGGGGEDSNGTAGPLNDLWSYRP